VFLPFWNNFEKIQVFKYHIKCVLVNSTVSDEMIITSSNLQIFTSFFGNKFQKVLVFKIPIVCVLVNTPVSDDMIIIFDFGKN